jgi:nucleotide-binding universal stress UspA family protein
MTRDPHRDIRRHLAAEAYEWRKNAMRRNRPHLQAVAAAPDETDEPAEVAPARPIVVGYDGTAGALPALTWALEEARGREVPLIIVRAWQWDDELAEPGLLGTQEQVEELAHSTLPDWARDAEGVSVVLAPRAAGAGIVEQGIDAAMIVVGRRRLGALQRAWLGSTSSYVVQHAPCPVVVVPETSGAACPSTVAPAGREQGEPAGSENPV